MIKLYHYSDKDIIKKLSVNYYGLNYFTKNDCAITTVKRLFFYGKPEPERLLNGARFLYIAEIDEKKLYNLTEDKKGFLKRARNIDGALRIFKKHYKGIIYNTGREIINLFNGINYKKKIAL
jgi:hypothetical protein